MSPTPAIGSAACDAASLARATLDTPLGPLAVFADAVAVRVVEFDPARTARHARRLPLPAEVVERPNSVIDRLADELAEYFRGTLTEFRVPVSGIGTDFERRVWAQLLAIPFGETTSYAAIARAIGEPGASRAVGRANGANPVSILVPCHRVVRTGGALGGYGGGLDRKRWLLDHEARVAGCALPFAG